MTFREYQERSRRTQNPALTDEERMLHAMAGIGSEAGEILSILQHRYQGKPIHVFDVADELGDLLWFEAELCDALHWDLDDVAAANVRKLQMRYPHGFSAARSEARHTFGEDGGGEC